MKRDQNGRIQRTEIGALAFYLRAASELRRRVQFMYMRKTPYAQDRDRDIWTEDERNQLKKMFNAGEELSEIALVLQRTELAICQQAMVMGLYVRKRRPKMEQTGCKCLCEKCAANKSNCPLRKLSEEGAACNV